MTEPLKVWKRLKRHWVWLLFTIGAFLLLIMGGMYRMINLQGTTPIAHISPEDSLKTRLLPGKLESYKKELLEQEKEAYKRNLALDEIVSMDFSQEMKKSTLMHKGKSDKGAEELDKVEEKQSAAPQTTLATLQNRPVSTKSVQRNYKPINHSTGVKIAADGFYTIRSEHSLGVKRSETDSHSFIKALIHGNQKVKGNGAICIRLLEEATWNNHTYPKNTILYGRIRGAVSGRVKIAISQINSSNVQLSVYDGDYSEGIAYQMREMVNEIAREGRNEALNEVFSSIPYGGIAGGLAQLGRSVTRKTGQIPNIYLSDGYQIFIVQDKKDK